MRTRTEPRPRPSRARALPASRSGFRRTRRDPRSRANTAMQRIPLPHCSARDPSALKIANAEVVAGIGGAHRDQDLIAPDSLTAVGETARSAPTSGRDDRVDIGHHEVVADAVHLGEGQAHSPKVTGAIRAGEARGTGLIRPSDLPPLGDISPAKLKGLQGMRTGGSGSPANASSGQTRISAPPEKRPGLQTSVPSPDRSLPAHFAMLQAVCRRSAADADRCLESDRSRHRLRLPVPRRRLFGEACRSCHPAVRASSVHLLPHRTLRRQAPSPKRIPGMHEGRRHSTRVSQSAS